MADTTSISIEVLHAYEALESREFTYLLFRLTGPDRIVLEATSSSRKYEVFLDDLPEDEPCWAVYDLPFDGPDGPGHAPVFVVWSPDAADSDRRAQYVDHTPALREALPDIRFGLVATGYGDIAHEALLAHVLQSSGS